MKLGAVKDALKNFGPVWRFRRARFHKLFLSQKGVGIRFGAYRTFDDARSNWHENLKLGYDNAECASLYSDRAGKIFPYDYAILYWLRPLLTDRSRIFDIGGHIGVHYYAYSKYLKELDQVCWTVCEVPTIAERGRKVAGEQRCANLAFTSDYSEMDGYDIVVSAGALQYIEAMTISEMIVRANKKPKHLLLNKVPLYAGPAYVTIENTGPCFNLYQNFNRTEFIASLVGQGYQLVDSWEVPGSTTHFMPFHPEFSYGFSSGLYFRLA